MKKQNPNYGETASLVNKEHFPVKVLSGIDIVKSMETGMNKATDNEKSKKQINKSMY